MFEVALNQEHNVYEPTARKVGGQALWQAGVFNPELGINDPLTHLEQYWRGGEAAIASIDEDLITDIAERKLKPTFINSVKFDRAGGDFISRENKFSMRQMTSATEDKFASDKTVDLEFYERAKIESLEVERLSKWFEAAETDDVFIVESLPLGDERYTVVRAHQKTGQNELTEHVITLHNASVGTFNQLHEALGADTPTSKTKLELMDNMYAYRPKNQNFDAAYVAAFDSILEKQTTGQKYSFGLPVAAEVGREDDIENVRRQKALRSVYLDNLRTLKQSSGYVTPEVIEASKNLGCSFTLAEGQEFSFDIARELLDRSLQSVAATFNQASEEQLAVLAASQDKYMAAGYAGHYGGQARAEGIRYDGACPSATSPRSAEAAALEAGHRHNKKPSQCGNCGKCGKEYFVPEKLYKDKILHCGSCKGSIHFDGSPVDQKKIDEYYGTKRSRDAIFRTESFSEYWARLGQEQELKKLRRRTDLANSA